MESPRILIVEDDAIQAAHLRRTLANANYTIIGPAATGEVATVLAETKKPDLILMDIRLMSRMNGVEAALDIHQNLGIPLIYLTAHSDPELVAQAQRAQPYAYLVKPVNEQELCATIEAALRDRASKKHTA